MKNLAYYLILITLLLGTFIMFQGMWTADAEHFALGFLIFIISVLFYTVALLKEEQYENMQLKQKIQELQRK
jgi:uncharacterized membrane protein YiaA